MAHTPASDDDFFDALLGEDSLGAVVRTHIHVETRVNQVITALIRHPNHLPKLQYGNQVKLAVALGLNEEILQPLRELGEIRNAFAHALNVKLTDSMVDRLWASFSVEFKKASYQVHTTVCTHQGMQVIPKFEKTDPKHRFTMMAIVIDKFLIDAEIEARGIR